LGAIIVNVGDEHPTGTVSFLFTDVEGSTGLWDQRPDEMGPALADHDQMVRAAVSRYEGYVFATGGDGFAAAFSRGGQAIAAADEVQAALAGHPFLRVRMGIHTGETQERDGDYFGPAVNTAARIMSMGCGGQVLISEAALSVADGGQDTTDLGLHRLQGIAETVQVHQLGDAEFLPLTRLSAVAGRLPTTRTSLVGREDLISRVGEAVRTGTVVSLTGVGGVGKTRIAVEFAARAAGRFRDGAFFVELAPVVEEAAVGEAVLAAVGLDNAPGESPLALLASVLDQAEALLVFDNAEHVVEEVADIVEELLEHCPSLAVLVTSREGLAVPGEHVIPVPPLSGRLQPGQQTSDRVRLLVDRALEVNPALVTTGPEAEALAAIADELDGVPLAIELAAARMTALSPTQVAERLSDRFALLTGGRRGRDRHQTLRATVQWSYDLLDAEDRDLFDQISAFPSGFVLPLAVGIAERDELQVIDQLEHLVSKNMLVFDPTDNGGRYRMLETLRQFGQENLEQQDRLRSVMDRRGEVLAGYVEELTGDLMFGPDERQRRAALLAESSNVVAVCEWSISSSTPESAARIFVTCATEIFQAAYGPLYDAADRLAHSMPRDSSLLPPVLAMACWGAVMDGQLELGERWLDLADELRDAGLEADWIPLEQSRAMFLAWTGRYEAAVGTLSDLVALGDEMDDPRAVAFAKLTSAYFLAPLGRYEEAVAEADEAIALASELGSEAYRAAAMAAKGYALAWFDPVAALPLLEQANEVLRSSGWAWLATSTQRSIARAMTAIGDVGEAAGMLREGLVAGSATTAVLSDHASAFYVVNLLARAGRWEEAAVANGLAADKAIGFLESPAYAELMSQARQEVVDNLGEERAEQLARQGAAMSREDGHEWMLKALDAIRE
jgi:predicted ATPase/class 3 adenylate cyclase